jgi:hypothetical protein
VSDDLIQRLREELAEKEKAIRDANEEHEMRVREALAAIKAQPAQEPVGKLPFKCTDCGHVQDVSVVYGDDGSRYFGSGANWCDKCNDGKPELIEQPAQEPVARYYGSEMSRYCIEWINGPLPEGTLLYASPQPSAEVERTLTMARDAIESISALGILGIHNGRPAWIFPPAVKDRSDNALAAIDAAMKGQP